MVKPVHLKSGEGVLVTLDGTRQSFTVRYDPAKNPPIQVHRQEGSRVELLFGSQV